MKNLRLRIAKVDEYQFLSCLKFSLWGSKAAGFRDWQVGDVLVFIVDKALAGYAEVVGPPFRSNEKVWENALLPYRIPITYKVFLAKDERIPILGKINEIIQKLGRRYGWEILKQQLITDKLAEELIDAISLKPNSLVQTQKNLEVLIQETAQLKQTNESKQKENSAQNFGVKF